LIIHLQEIIFYRKRLKENYVAMYKYVLI